MVDIANAVCTFLKGLWNDLIGSDVKIVDCDILDDWYNDVGTEDASKEQKNVK